MGVVLNCTVVSVWRGKNTDLRGLEPIFEYELRGDADLYEALYEFRNANASTSKPSRGPHTVRWETRDKSGDKVASGVFPLLP